MKLPIVFLLGCLAITCIAYPTVQDETGGMSESAANEESSEENREQRPAKMIQPIRYTTPKQPSAEDTQQVMQQSEVRRRRQSDQVDLGQGQPLESTSEQPTTQTAQPEQQQSEVRRRRQSDQVDLGQGEPLESTTEQPTTQSAQPQQQSEVRRRRQSDQMDLGFAVPLSSSCLCSPPPTTLLLLVCSVPMLFLSFLHL